MMNMMCLKLICSCAYIMCPLNALFPIYLLVLHLVVLNQLSSLLQPPKQNDEAPTTKEEEEGKNGRHLPDWIVGAASRVKLNSSKVKNGTDNKKLAKSKGLFRTHFLCLQFSDQLVYLCSVFTSVTVS